MKFWQKTITLITTFSLLTNSLAAPLTVLAQESPTPEPTSIPTESPVATETVIPTESPSVTVEPSSTPTSTPDVTPADSAILTPTETPLATDSASPDPSPTDQPVQNQEQNSNPTAQGPPSDSNQSVATSEPSASPSTTPTATPNIPEEEGNLTTTVIEDVDLSEIVLLNSNVDGNSNIIVTDKADYAPTDVVLITGTNFTPEKSYTLEISSNDEPPVTANDTVIADSEGNFSYAYQLDGNYRPNYKIDVKDGEFVVASTTFTDSDSGFLSPSSNTNNNGVSSPENAYTSNNQYAVFDSSSDRVDYRNFGFSIPSGSTINGIEVSLEGNRDSLRTWDVSLSYDGGAHFSSPKSAGGSFSLSDSSVTIGANNDVWGRIWSSENLSDSNFRVRVDATSNYGSGDVIKLDLIQVKITYTPFVNVSPMITEGDSTSVTISKNGTPTPFSLTLHATDPDAGQTLTWSISSAASHGAAGASGTGTSKLITYTPTSNYVGTDSFVVQVSDGNGGTDTITINVTIQETDISNPTLSQACGLDIAIILDNSTSIDSSEMTQMKNAVKAFTNALNGTPTQFSVTHFATTATVDQPFTSNISTVNSKIDNIPVGAGYTNWQDGFTKGWGTFDPRTDHPNLVIFASDGNPNRTGTSGTSVTESQAVSDAQVVANLIKTNGARILAIGIGADLNTANMEAISGTQVNTGDITTSDVITTNFSGLATQLADFATRTCGGTITVHKDVTGEINPDLSGWQFTVNGHDYPTDSNGYTQAISVSTGTYSVTEISKSGYTLAAKSCTKNNSQSVGSPTTSGVENISVGASDIISCSFTNNLDPYCGNAIVDSGEQCDDGNSVNNDACTNTCRNPICGDEIVQSSIGEQCDLGANNKISCTPAYGGQCSFCNARTCQNETITGPYCGDGIVNGSEQCDDGNSVNNDSCTNSCTFNNGSIKIIKNSQPDNSQSFHFTYVDNAYPIGDFNIVDNGTGSNFVEFTSIPAGTYSWSEDQVAGWHLSGLTCSENVTNNSSVNLDTRSVNIALDPGESVICTFTNIRDTGSITFAKRVDQGPAQPNDWTFAIYDENGELLGDNFSNGKSYTIETGNYLVTESSVEGYSFDSVSGVCSTNPTNGSIILNVTPDGGTCTIGNKRNTGSVKVNKRIDINGDGDWNDSNESNNSYANSHGFSWTLDGVSRLFGIKVDNQATTLSNYYHNFSESMPSGYHFVGWYYTGEPGRSCSNPNGKTLPDRIQIDKDQTTEITLCNTRDVGTITIIKDAINNSDENFRFDVNSSFPGGDFELEDDGHPGNGGTPEQRIFNVPTGSYTVTEVQKDGWKLTSLTCSGNGSYSVTERARKVDISLKANENVTCKFTNTELGKISGYKFKDENTNGRWDWLQGERALGNWRVFIDEGNGVYDGTEPSRLTNSWIWYIPFWTGYYEFDSLLPGIYSVCEEPQNGWTNVTPICRTVDLTPGDTDNVNFGNINYGTVTVTKFNDENQNGIFDNGESTLNGWTINLDQNSLTTGENGQNEGQVLFTGITQGNHGLNENLKEGWRQTNIYCDRTNVGDLNVSTQSTMPTASYLVYAEAGQNINCYIGNFEEKPNLTISKSNDKFGGIGAGQTITYTLKVTNEGNIPVGDISIQDVLPGGFTYIPGSTNGTTTVDPTTEGSKLTWTGFETLEVGGTITISYQVKSSSGLINGTYTNFATCKASTRNSGNLRFVILATDQETDGRYTECNTASSTVTIDNGTSYGGSLGGQVLGISTVLGASTELPATGSPTGIVVAALGMIGFGLLLNGFMKMKIKEEKSVKKEIKNKKVVKSAKKKGRKHAKK